MILKIIKWIRIKWNGGYLKRKKWFVEKYKMT